MGCVHMGCVQKPRTQPMCPHCAAYRLYPELDGALNTTETLDLLIRYIIDTWNRLREELLNKLIDILIHRVEAIIKAEGWYTKY